ncbi:MAG: zinc-binding dehydrogenase [Deltaproteobacteria bacterium]|nr:zinc-binding dehydrogenase [Deltaproteobacteria bacterium]
MGEDTMRAWRTHQYGPPLEALQLDLVPIPAPGPGELLVRVQAIPLNLNDLERINGGNVMVRHELPYAAGMEVFGVVEAAGAGAEARVGQRVAAMTKGAIGGYAEYAICPGHSAFEIDAAIPLPDAAALYFPFHLAWLGLFDRAQLKRGESVLIHAAAGGSGSAAIQLAVNAGARVFATAGGADKVALCRSLGAEVAIDYASEDFAAIVMEKTANRGVDVVFDNVGAAVFEKSLACTAYDGRYLMMGFASDKTVLDEKFIVPRRVIVGNLKLCGVLLAYAPEPVIPMMKKGMGWNFLPASRGAEITREITAQVARGKLKPVIGRVAKFDEIPREIHALATRATTGRTIVML